MNARRWQRAGLGLAGAMVFAALEHACVIAAPSGDLPRPPLLRPTIVHSALVPRGPVIMSFPDEFLVTVELPDPTVSFFYAAFIDYNPRTGEGLVLEPRESRVSPANLGSGPEARRRTVQVALPAPTSLETCHTIEIVVGYRLGSRLPQLVHSPEDPGGDIATWLYNPGGDLQGCPALDAGIARLSSDDAGDAESDAALTQEPSAEAL